MVVDGDDTTLPVEGRELGTAFDRHSILFSTFSDGTAFDYGEFEAADINEMLERDGKARTLEQVLTLPIRSAPTSIVKGGAKADAKAIDLVTQALTTPANNGGMSTPLNLVVAQMTGAISTRRAFFEKVFKYTPEDTWVYDKVAWRPASTCTIVRDKDTGSFQGFKQIPVRWTQGQDASGLWIKPKYAFVYLHGLHRNPITGTSDLEIPMWCYKTKEKIRFLWYQYLEAQSLPKTVVKGKDEGSANNVARKLVGLRQGGVVGVDMSGIDAIDTLESSGKGADQFKSALAYLDSEASGSVLAGFTDLTAAASIHGAGSLALSKDQTDFFLMSRKAVTLEMADCINQFLIPDLVKYNLGTKTACPEFEFGQISEQDSQVAITLLQALAAAPTLNLPKEFLDELVVKVAVILGLDEVKVEAAIAKAVDQAVAVAPTPAAARVAPVVGAVGAATRLVQAQQQTPAA